MKSINFNIKFLFLAGFCLFFLPELYSENIHPKFKVIAFYTGRSDQAHISYVAEALKWFPEISRNNKFSFNSTSDWANMNADFLSNYQLVIFLDTRPEKPEQREAFRKYMDRGGAWLGFHFSGFALSPSSFPQNWDWYHEEFLGSGQYKSNTWRPTAAILKVEYPKHKLSRKLPRTFLSAPNEWYRWENDLRTNPDIRILLSIDPSSFPLGTGPKPHEIWYEGYYPVVWTNINYRMIYMNMGHNDIDYKHKFDNTNQTLSFTFENEVQNTMLVNAILWLGKNKKIAN